MEELHDINIPVENLKYMPPGRILGAYLIQDMDGNDREVLKIRWIETLRNQAEIRISYFAINNGEYCGESIT